METAVINIPSGIGDPFFRFCREHTFAFAFFTIPAVKGVEFGEGFNISSMKGSQANDEYYVDDNNEIKTKTNNNGGILGGITNGMPILFKTSIKPTASISKLQKTVDVEKTAEF